MDFVIAAPAYSHRSGGIMALHELCSTLNRLGHRAGLALITAGSQDEQNYQFGYSNTPEFLDPQGAYHDYFTGRSSEEIHAFIRNACAVYPDIVKGNPLNAGHFATYVLGVPKYPIVSEFILSFSRTYHDSPDFVLSYPFINEWMTATDTLHWTQRTLNLTYIGKGELYAECHTVPGTVLIERDWPRDKRQLAALLRHCKYFFSWDARSATNLDAVLCGAVPVLMQTVQVSDDELKNSEFGSLPPIAYEEGMENRTPADVEAIDAAFANIRQNCFASQAQWPANVARWVELLAGRFNPA